MNNRENDPKALEMRCYRRLLNISYKDHVTNEEVRNRIQNATGVHDDLLTMVKKRKLRWYGHISRSSGMAKTILQGTVKGARRRGRQKKRLEDNIKKWPGMGFGDSLMASEDREGWKGIVPTSSVVSRRPPRLRDWDEMRWDGAHVNLSLLLFLLVSGVGCVFCLWLFLDFTVYLFSCFKSLQSERSKRGKTCKFSIFGITFIKKYYFQLALMLWIPHNLNNSLRTVNINFSIFLDFMEFPNISINNLKLFDVNVILTLTIRFSWRRNSTLNPHEVKKDIGHFNNI